MLAIKNCSVDFFGKFRRVSRILTSGAIKKDRWWGGEGKGGGDSGVGLYLVPAFVSGTLNVYYYILTNKFRP